MSNISQKERFVIVAEGHPLRSEVERIVTERYNQAFNANVDEFMPNFSCLLGQEGRFYRCVASALPLRPPFSWNNTSTSRQRH